MNRVSQTNMSPPTPAPDKRNTFFHDLLKLQVRQVGGGSSKVELEVEERHLRTLGILHGGVLASLLDTVLGTACHSLAPADHYTVTVQLNLNFIRPAWHGETLIGTGTVLHAGRQTAVARGEVHTGAGVLVGAATATFMYLPHTEQTRNHIEKLPDDTVRRPLTDLSDAST